MEKWEYLVAVVEEREGLFSIRPKPPYQCKDVKAEDEIWNLIGKDGWEMTHYFVSSGSRRAVFKRLNRSEEEAAPNLPIS